jgi:hypothetical protein
VRSSGLGFGYPGGIEALSNLRKPSPALIISIIALIVALAGTATAVSTKITSSQIAKNAITSKKIKKNAVTSPKIKDGEVKTEDIGLNAVTSDRIGDAQVATGDLAELAVTTGKIAGQGVTAAKIADLAVTTGKLAASAVTSGKIADAAVSTAKIADGSVTGPKLASISTVPTADVNVPTGESRAATATCPAGEVAISGGVHFNGANNADAAMGILHSYRLASSSWLARAFNNSGVQQTFQVYVFCLAG